MFSATADSDFGTSGHGFHARHLTVAFDGIEVVGDVLIDADPGEITGIAGESGSGKTTAVLTAIGYLPGGAIKLAGRSQLGGDTVLGSDSRHLRRLWGKRISYVPQDAAASLNPVRRVGSLLRETLTVNLRLNRRQAEAKALGLLESVQIQEPLKAMRRYPHEFSGGQVQRIAIALAIATDPELIVLDEPTTGLDVTTQADVIGMLGHLIRQRGIAAIYISHDIALLSSIAHTLIVLYAGEVVEQGSTSRVLASPRHPYTRALLNAVPSIKESRLPIPIPGLPPGRVIHGSCPFANRCVWRIDACSETHPELQAIVGESRTVRCLRQPDLGPLRSQEVATRSQPAFNEDSSPVLSVSGLRCTYGRGSTLTVAVQDVSFGVQPREVLALVGESGSGKSTIGRAIVGLVTPKEGHIAWKGTRVGPTSEQRLKEHRQAIQIIFQNPDSSLNPRHTVYALIERSIVLFREPMNQDQRSKAVRATLVDVQLDPSVANRFPHQLSGGQKQRVAIARALAARPEFLICDEIVSGQDVSVQAVLLDLLKRLQAEYHMSILFISHDLAVVRSIADHVAVMRQGRVVEYGLTSNVLSNPASEYTRTLLRAVPI